MMKRITAAFLALVICMGLAGCGGQQEPVAVSAEIAATPESTATPTPTPTPEPTATPKPSFITLGFTIENLSDIVSSAKEISNFLSFSTQDFTVCKAGSTTSGVVCFALPDTSEISTVYFLSYAGASSSAWHRTEAKQAQKVLADYCDACGIETVVSEMEIDNTLVFAVESKDSPFLNEDLPITIRSFRSPNEFFSDEARKDVYVDLLNKCDYVSLKQLVDNFISQNEIDLNDPITDISISIDDIVAASVECVASFDAIEGKGKVHFSSVENLSTDTWIVPTLITQKYTGAAVEYEIGFTRSDWLFWDNLVVSDGASSQDFSFKPYNVNRDVISGSMVKEYIFCDRSDIDSALFDACASDEPVIRFTNSGTHEYVDHILTSDEKDAIISLKNIKRLHTVLFYAPDLWEKQ